MLFRPHVFSILSLCLAICAGCDQPAANSSQPAATNRSNGSATAAPANAPTATTYGSVDAAVAAFKTACASLDNDGIRDTTRYLSQQGGSAVGPMGQLANDAAADVGTRVMATRVLAMIGTEAAAEQILAASRADESKVRVKAAESLGVINPPTTPIVDRLIALLDDSDRYVKSAAIRSIKAIGPQAKRAEPKLQEILNSDAPEQLRGEAHAALKKVAPRVGFRQGELDE